MAKRIDLSLRNRDTPCRTVATAKGVEGTGRNGQEAATEGEEFDLYGWAHDLGFSYLNPLPRFDWYDVGGAEQPILPAPGCGREQVPVFFGEDDPPEEELILQVVPLQDHQVGSP